MKVLFVVTGIGYGDSTREDANIKAFKKAFPRAKVLVACYDNSYEYFKDKYETVRIQGYKLPGKQLKIQLHRFILANVFLPVFWLTSTLKVKLEKFKFVPDVIVSDFEPIGISLAKLLGKRCIVLFGFDPYLYDEYKKKNRVNLKLRTEARYFQYLYNNADMVLIPSLRVPKPRRLDYVYINPVIRKMSNQLPSEKVIMKSLMLRKKPILVMLGGSKFGTKLAMHINKVAVRMKEDFIIFGGDLRGVNLHKNVTYIRYSDDFLKYLKICKGIITLGGQITLAEAILYKKPVLCFPIKDHIEQVLNAYSVRDVVMIGHDSSLKGLRKILPSFIRSLPVMKKKLEKYKLRGNGSKEFVDMVKIVTGKS